MQVRGLFPIPIGEVELGREFTDAEVEFARRAALRPNMYNQSSMDSYVLNQPELADLKGFIEKSIDQFFQVIWSPATDVSLRITQSWLNLTRLGQAHHLHYHPNSFVSGVLYIKADEEKDQIKFHSHAYNFLSFGAKEFNQFNSTHWWLPAKTGSLILFPSYLHHEVDKVSSDERISLSFNTFPVGTIGVSDNLNELKLEG